MNDNDISPDQTKTRVLTLIFALAITLVALAIGSVAWHLIDSLQKHTERVHDYHATGENAKIDIHQFDVIRSELDTRIIGDKMDPSRAIQAPIVKLEGSEIAVARGTKAIDKRQFVQAAADFTEALAMIPVEANLKASWHLDQTLVDKRVYQEAAYEQRACCYMETGHFTLAIADLTAAIKLRPDYILNYQNRAKVYNLLGKKALGAADLRKIQTLSAIPSKKP